MMPFKTFRPVAIFCVLLLIGFSTAAVPPGGVEAVPLPETDLGKGLGPEDYTSPIPIQTGDLSNRIVQANRIYFFQHPVSDSSVDFGDLFSQIQYTVDGVHHILQVQDLIGAPHFLYSDDRPAGAMDRLLEDPADLCMKGLLHDLSCPRGVVTDSRINKLNGGQLVADLRNLHAGEENVRGVTLPEVLLSARPYREPYTTHPLSMLTAQNNNSAAKCYDITATEDWLACPVFGKLFVSNDKVTVELESPVVIYRLSEGVYQLAGYLANPTLEEYREFNPLEGAPILPMPSMPLGNALFPMAIESGQFFEGPGNGPKGESDIAVFSTATLPRYMCDIFMKELKKTGRENNLPHLRNCSYGFLWGRVSEDWDRPLREIFDAVAMFIAPPKVYDIAAGWDDPIQKDLGVTGKEILFAASGEKAADGKHYIYKYFGRSDSNFLLHSMRSVMPPLVVPEVVPIKAPSPGFDPFRIRTFDINQDGFSDFALTWLFRNLTYDGFSLKHKGIFSPVVSVFLSRIVNNQIQYDQFDLQPGDANAQIAGVDFGSRGGQNFMVAGDYRTRGDDALVYTVPINEGLVETLKTSTLPVRFKSDVAGTFHGVSDVAVDKQRGVIAALQRDPFLRAPEGCDIRHAEVYGHYWFGSPNFFMGAEIKLDMDRDGVPNRCECRVDNRPNAATLFPNDDPGSPGYDGDLDEIAAQCDTCPDFPNIGDADGNGVDDACERNLNKADPRLEFNRGLDGPDRIFFDQVVPPRAGMIADTRDLRFAAAVAGNDFQAERIDPAEGQDFKSGDLRKRLGVVEEIRPEVVPQSGCGFAAGVYPGGLDCGEMRGQQNDITILLPKVGKEILPPPEPPLPPPPPVPDNGVAMQQFCIARVGRSDPRMVSPVPAVRKKIMAANDRVQAITGLKDFDIFVGSDGGLIRWECYLAGGAAPKIAAAKNILPDVSGNIASFGVWQIKGLPVEKNYNFAPNPNDRIDPKLAMRLAPLDDARAFAFSVAGGRAAAAGALAPGGVPPGGILGALPVPNVGGLIVNRSEQVIPDANVQFGHLRQNIAGNMVLKVLNSEADLGKEGVAFSASDTHSIITIDYKTPPAPFTNIPVEDRPYALMNIDKTLDRLEQLVSARKKRGEAIDVTIFRELGWGEVMQTEFLLAQETIPEALAGVSKVVGGSIGVMPEVAAVGPAVTPTNRIILPAFVVEPSMLVQGTGFCRLQTGVEPSTGMWVGILWILSIPALVRWRLRRKSI